ncbi:unnamed protein product [Toxocara canis]|uniref:50S ribosomal protein L33 n=1 Tax=Toxocara canis TaxID=6265 RepID=A0A183V8A7_TOXCA|nr:unnamed protein product [Toxocara canis]
MGIAIVRVDPRTTHAKRRSNPFRHSMAELDR